MKLKFIIVGVENYNCLINFIEKEVYDCFHIIGKDNERGSIEVDGYSDLVYLYEILKKQLDENFKDLTIDLTDIKEPLLILTVQKI